MLGEFDRRPVVFYLLQLMHVLPQSASEADTDHIYTVVENWFLACSDGEIVSLSCASFPGDDALFRRAKAILTDHSLRDWVFSHLLVVMSLWNGTSWLKEIWRMQNTLASGKGMTFLYQGTANTSGNGEIEWALRWARYIPENI